MSSQATICKIFRFEAAHHLPNHDGKCARPHGHGYRVEVYVAGEVRPQDGASSEGMVMDFADVSAVWDANLKPLLDHQDLNETVGGVTTAENLALWTMERFIAGGVPVCRVTLWETDTCNATVSR